MNQQNISNTPELPVKRKRGRPRKDESMPRNVKQHTQPPLAMAAPPPAMITAFQPPPTAIQPPQTTIPTTNNINKVDPNMVGQAVTCVIDGIFDNGYLLSTRLGPYNSILRGIVFQQGHVASVTPANDVAPHVDMCTRVEFPIPPLNPRNSTGIQICTPESVCAKQPVAMQNYQNTPPSALAGAAMVTGGSVSSTSAAPQQESLRLVEQDDVMQVFEVNKTVEQQETQDCDQRSKNEHVVVTDPMDESFPENEPLVNESQDEPLVNEIQNEPVVNEIQNKPVVDESQNEPVVNKSQNEQQDVKEPDGEKPELITSVETVVENQPSMTNDKLPQENQEQTGEVNNIDANQDLNQGVGVDLSLSNFPEI